MSTKLILIAVLAFSAQSASADVVKIVCERHWEDGSSSLLSPRTHTWDSEKRTFDGLKNGEIYRIDGRGSEVTIITDAEFKIDHSEGEESYTERFSRTTGDYHLQYAYNFNARRNVVGNCRVLKQAY